MGFWQMLDNAIIRCVDDDGDSGLGHPREGLGQEVVQPVEVPAGEAELVGDGASRVKVVENALVPLCNRGVELEPHPLEVRGFGEGDFQRGRTGSWLPAVVGKVNAGLGAGVVGVGLAIRPGLLLSKDGYGIDAVDFHTNTGLVVKEGLFQGKVVRFPSDDLGVRASKVNVPDDVAWVWGVELPNVGEDYFRTETHFYSPKIFEHSKLQRSLALCIVLRVDHSAELELPRLL